MLLSDSAFIVWDQASWTEELVGGYDHVCSGLCWACGVWGKLEVVNTASTLEDFRNGYHRRPDEMF